MVKGHTTISIDPELRNLARLRNMNISQEFNEFLKFRLSCFDDVAVEDEVEQTKIQIEEIKNNYERELAKYNNKLTILKSKLEERKKEIRKEQLLISDPIVKESIQVARNEPKYFFGRLKLLQGKGYDIDEFKFKDLVENKKEVDVNERNRKDCEGGWTAPDENIQV
jgi:hypothetical protein